MAFYSFMFPAVIGIGKQEVGSEAGVNEVSVRLHGIASVTFSADRQIERFGFLNYRRILDERSITAIYITVLTSRADFGTAVPQIPS